MVVQRHGPDELRPDATPSGNVDGLGNRSGNGPDNPANPTPEVPGFSDLVTVGSGPRGTVYRALDGRHTVALKVLRHGVELDRPTVEHFLPESPERIRHPNLPVVRSIAELADQRLALSTDYLRGDSLACVLDDLHRQTSNNPSLCPLSVGDDGEIHPELPRRAAELIAEVCDGLSLVHAAGLAHGAIRPENLIFSPTGRLVLTDFGLSKRPRNGGHSNGSSETTVTSTADGGSYAAPDAYTSGTPKATDDVFSLGAILLATVRRQPYSETLLRELHLNGKDGGDLPEGLKHCLRKATEANASARYAGARQFAEDLRRYLSERKTRAELEIEKRAAALLAAQEAETRAAEESKAAALANTTRATGLSARLLSQLQRHRRLAAGLLFGVLILGGYVGSRLFDDNTNASPTSASPSSVVAVEHRNLANPSTEAGPVATLLTAPENGTATDVTVEHVFIAPATVPLPKDRLHSELLVGSATRRLAALEQLRLEIADGIRPLDSVRLAIPLLHSNDPRLRRKAMEAVALENDAARLIYALGIGPAETPLALQEKTFALLLDILTETVDRQTDDVLSRDLLCTWSLDEALRLDRAALGTVEELSPNLRIHMGPKDGRPEDGGALGDRGFTRRWIRLTARVDPAALAAATPRLTERRELLPLLLEEFSHLEPRLVSFAVYRLAREHYIDVGRQALETLGKLGDFSRLLDIAVSELPLRVRREALQVLGARFEGPHFPELRTLALSSPDAALRRSAFGVLATCETPVAASIIVETVNDFELQEESIAWLRRLPGNVSAPLSLELLGNDHAMVRAAAREVLEANCDQKILLPLLRRLFDDEGERRQDAIAILGHYRATGCYEAAWTDALRHMQASTRKVEAPFARAWVGVSRAGARMWDQVRNWGSGLRGDDHRTSDSGTESLHSGARANEETPSGR